MAEEEYLQEIKEIVRSCVKGWIGRKKRIKGQYRWKKGEKALTLLHFDFLWIVWTFGGFTWTLMDFTFEVQVEPLYLWAVHIFNALDLPAVSGTTPTLRSDNPSWESSRGNTTGQGIIEPTKVESNRDSQSGSHESR